MRMRRAARVTSGSNKRQRRRAALNPRHPFRFFNVIGAALKRADVFKARYDLKCIAVGD